MSSVGFIGLGHMGEGMARRLLNVGNRNLVVWNRSAEKVAALVKEGDDRVTVAATAKAVLDACELVYIMLSTPDVVRQVYEMEGGVLDGVTSKTQIVECATLAVEDMERLASQVKERGGRFLEAPVSGSKVPAANGQLVFLTGGDEALYSSVAADLDAMGKAKFFLGAVGAGTRMKLCVNMTMGTMLAAYGEALTLGQSEGLNPAQLIEVLSLGVCASPLLQGKAAKMVAGDHVPNFPLKHAQKDMRLAIELGAASGLALPVADSANNVMKNAMGMGCEEMDFSATFEAQKKKKQKI